METAAHQVLPYPEPVERPDLPTHSGREPILRESSTNRNLLSDIIDSLELPDPELLSAYRESHQAAIDAHLKHKVEEKSEAEIAARTPEGQAYAERLQQINNPVSRLDSILAKVRQQVRFEPRQQCMDFYDAKQVVSELLIVKLARENRQLFLSEEQKEVLRDLTAYFIGDSGSSIPLTKGIFLYGAVGVGKSFLMKILQTFCEVADINSMRFREVSTKSLIQEVADANSLQPTRAYFSGNVLFDDLGEEKQEIKLYGNPEKPMDLLITERYKSYQDRGHLTHITSNLMPKQLGMYGTRLFDRLSDMTHAVLLPGGSKRG